MYVLLSFQSEWAPGMVGVYLCFFVLCVSFKCVWCVSLCVVCLPNDDQKAKRSSHTY